MGQWKRQSTSSVFVGELFGDLIRVEIAQVETREYASFIELSNGKRSSIFYRNYRTRIYLEKKTAYWIEWLRKMYEADEKTRNITFYTPDMPFNVPIDILARFRNDPFDRRRTKPWPSEASSASSSDHCE